MALRPPRAPTSVQRREKTDEASFASNNLEHPLEHSAIYCRQVILQGHAHRIQTELIPRIVFLISLYKCLIMLVFICLFFFFLKKNKIRVLPQ